MSNILNVDLKDALKGVLLAVAASVLVTIQGYLTSNSPIDWVLVLKVAEGTLVSYIIKQYFTDADGKLFGKI